MQPKYISPEEAAKKLTEYGVSLFESLKEIKKQYPEQVIALYRAMLRHIGTDEPAVLAEIPK